MQDATGRQPTVIALPKDVQEARNAIHAYDRDTHPIPFVLSVAKRSRRTRSHRLPIRLGTYQTTPTPPRTLALSPLATAAPALTKTCRPTRALMPMATACSLL